MEPQVLLTGKSLLLSVSGYASKLGKVKICVSELPHVGYVWLCFTLGCCMEKTWDISPKFL